MLSMMFIVIGVIAAILLLSLIPKVPARATKVALTVVAVFAVFAGIFLSSFRFIPEDKLGVVVRNIGPKLEAGKIIATSGEAGPQARILPPGWHSGYWPFIYDIEIHPLVEVSEGSVAILTAKDGKPLPEGEMEPLVLGYAAATCLARAIARGVHAARAEPGDPLPTWADRFGGR